MFHRANHMISRSHNYLITLLHTVDTTENHDRSEQENCKFSRCYIKFVYRKVPAKLEAQQRPTIRP